MTDATTEDQVAALRQRISELEKALSDADSQRANLLEIAGDSVFVVNPQTQQIYETNTNAARRLGYGYDEILSIPYSQIEIRPADQSGVWESALSQTEVYECVLRCKDGSEIPVEVSSRMVRHEGRAALLNFARDISRRKQVEAEREQLIVELDTYAQMVAHDLKNPVALLMGYSEMLVEDFRSLSETELAEHLNMILHSSIKMRNIIDDLLLLASIRSIREVETEPLEMAAVVQEALSHLTLRIEESNAVIQQPDEWPQAVGYAPWVEQVWANYISNAIKYGGAPPHIEVGATLQEDFIIFWVRDNGTGISEDNQKRLFEQFTRFDKARAEGHGLGLSIVKLIVNKLGGAVGADSTPEKGSTFYFTLPALQ